MSIPETRPSLLIRLRNPQDREAWEEFVALYRHVICRLAVRRGMQNADAEDLTQQVLWSISRAINRFEPNAGRGRFRSWLRKIAHHAMINSLTRRAGERSLGGTAGEMLFEELAALDPADSPLEAEYRREIFLVAATQVRSEVGDETWACFWETTVRGRKVEDVAEQFHRTRGSIYTARCRIIKRLKEKVERLDQQEEPS